MSYRIFTEERPNRVGLDPEIYVLEDDFGSRIEVWPALGFDCYRWTVAGREVLYAAPEFFEQKKPTRSGFPMLFPFPNRIRAGRFSWQGRDYQLACNDPSGKNAIHGFACHDPWTVIDRGTSGADAWLTGEFQASRAQDRHATNWPADYRVRLTYRLAQNRLRLEARIDNPDSRPLPFGLGYHPYFRTDFFGGNDCVIQVPASAYWELQENLPTGKIMPVAGNRDLRGGQKFAGLQLDDVLTRLDTSTGSGLVLRGALRSPSANRAMEMWTSPEFREMVVFTPPHRQAICLEPYTCTTDAVNLRQRNIDAGWRVLEPGASEGAVVDIVMKGN